MNEFDLGELNNYTEHLKNADAFIKFIEEELAKKFKNLKFSANNTTSEDLKMLPEMIILARMENDDELAKDLEDHLSEIDSPSANMSSILVSIEGDIEDIIEKATKEINQKAQQLNGKNVVDSGINHNSTREILPKIIGNKPRLEDIPMKQRFLNYEFK